MSSQLNALGFMGYLGDQLSGVVAGYSWPGVYISLMVVYVLIHYLEVADGTPKPPIESNIFY